MVDRVRSAAAPWSAWARQALVLLAAAPAGLLLVSAAVVAASLGGSALWGVLLAVVVVLSAGRSTTLRAAERRRMHLTVEGDIDDRGASPAGTGVGTGAAHGGVAAAGTTGLAAWVAVRLTVATLGAAALSTAAACWGLAAGAVAFDGSVERGPWMSRAGWASAWMLPAAAAVALVAVGVVLAMVRGLAALAPVLLAPTTTERADAAERRARRAAARNHLARELHDTIGHTLTVTTVQAAAARRLVQASPTPDRERLLELLTTIETTGRETVTELDHALRALRDHADRADHGVERRTARTPAPTLADLPRLVRQVRATGLPLTATVTGDVRAVPALCSGEAYRLIQEGLTNVLRHAGAVPTTLILDAAPAAVTISLQNSRPATTPPPSDDPDGRERRGLLGARERVTALGGSLHATAVEDAWVLRATLPGHATASAGSAAT